MRSPTVGLGTLRRLGALEWHGPVASTFLALDPSSVQACDAELDLVAAGACSGHVSAIERTRRALGSLPDFAYGTRGLALFASARELELVPLPEQVAMLTVLGAQPWLEPLAGMACPGRSSLTAIATLTGRHPEGRMCPTDAVDEPSPCRAVAAAGSSTATLDYAFEGA